MTGSRVWCGRGALVIDVVSSIMSVRSLLLLAMAGGLLFMSDGCSRRPAAKSATVLPDKAWTRQNLNPPFKENEIVELTPEQREALNARAEALARFSLGLSRELEGNPLEALEEFKLAAMADPSNEELALDATRRLMMADRLEEARELLSKTASLTNASGDVHAQLGWICLQLGRKAEALAQGRLAISKAPGNLSGYRTLVAAYVQDKKFKEAAQILAQACRQKGDVFYLLDLVELHGQYLQAGPDNPEQIKQTMRTLLEQARSLKPDNVGLILKMADGYAAAGDTRKAAELLLEMQERHAGIPELRDAIRAKLTAIYLQGKERKKAMEQLEAVIKDYPLNPQAYYYLGGLAFEEKEFNKAAEYLGKTIMLNPQFEPAYYDTAAAQMNANRADDALKTLERARQRFAPNFTLEYYTGLAYTRNKQYTEALKAFTAAEVIARSSSPERLTPSLYFQIGACYERVKNYDEAERFFQKAIEMDPQFAEALNYLGYMWAERNVNLDKAKELLERALKIEPKNAAFLDSMGWIYYRLGQLSKALQYVSEAVKLSTEPDATLHDHLGDIYAALKQWDKAREAWRKAIEIEPNDEIKKKLETAPAQ